MKERKQKTLVYKHVVFHSKGPKLSDSLSLALDKMNIGSRREALAPAFESPIWRVIGYYKIESGFVFGVLMRYSPGTNSAVLIDDVNAEVLTIEQYTAPTTEEGKRRELVEDMLFFGAIDNHLVMMQSSGLRAEHLEVHIQWLLHKAKTLSNQNLLQLTDQMPKAIRDQLSKQKVKSLQIGGAFVPVPEGEIADNTGTSVGNVTITQENTSSNGILASIKSLLDPEKASLIDLNALKGSNIEYTLNIKYRRSTTDDGHAFMNTLGSALRNAEGVNTEIDLVGGGKLKGTDLKLSGSIRVTMYDGLPNADDVFVQMKTWLLEQIQSGDVKPT